MLINHTHPDLAGLTAKVTSLGGTVIAVLPKWFPGPRVEGPIDSWIVLWRRDRNYSPAMRTDFVTHRVYAANPTALDHGHYDMLDVEEIIADVRERVGSLTIERELQIRRALQPTTESV